MTKQFPCIFSIISILLLLLINPLFAQENAPESDEEENIPVIIPITDTEPKEIDWNQIHLMGITYQQSFKKMDVDSGSDSKELEYNIQSLGINYGSFSGSRLGFYSDLNLLFPFLSQFESGNIDNNSGFSIDYIGSVGWSLWTGKAGFLPFLGFHSQYTFLSSDPLDENQSNHMLSVGIGSGLNFLYKLKTENNLYAGIKVCLDTIEFTSASYDSREVQLQNKMSYMISLGYAYTVPTVKKVLQPSTEE